MSVNIQEHVYDDHEKENNPNMHSAVCTSDAACASNRGEYTYHTNVEFRVSTVLHTKSQKLSLFDTFEIFSAILQANHTYNISS